MSSHLFISIIIIASMQFYNICCGDVPTVIAEIVDTKFNYTRVGKNTAIDEVHVKNGADLEMRLYLTNNSTTFDKCKLKFQSVRVPVEIKAGYCLTTIPNANKSHRGIWEWHWRAGTTSGSTELELIVDNVNETTLTTKNEYETTATDTGVYSSTTEEEISFTSEVTIEIPATTVPISKLLTSSEQEITFISELTVETMSTPAQDIIAALKSTEENPKATTKALEITAYALETAKQSPETTGQASGTTTKTLGTTTTNLKSSIPEPATTTTTEALISAREENEKIATPDGIIKNMSNVDSLEKNMTTAKVSPLQEKTTVIPKAATKIIETTMKNSKSSTPEPKETTNGGIFESFYVKIIFISAIAVLVISIGVYFKIWTKIVGNNFYDHRIYHLM